MKSKTYSFAARPRRIEYETGGSIFIELHGKSAECFNEQACRVDEFESSVWVPMCSFFASSGDSAAEAVFEIEVRRVR